jgi:cell division protein FtsI/penicillin-binding protein 2
MWLFNNLKEKLLFFFVICLYIFICLAVLLNNITHYPSKKTQEYIPEIVSQEQIVLAKNQIGYVYYLDNKKNIDEEEVSKFIRKHFQNSTCNLKKKSFYLLGKKIALISDSLPKGIIVRRENIRYYPYGEIFAYPIGLSNGNIIFGLEVYNKKHALQISKSKNKQLNTTIIFPLQYHLYEGAKKGLKNYRAKSIHGLIQNETGEIVAMISLPNFDPNGDKTPTNTNNGVLYNIFEFGSTIKIFSFLLAVHKNLISKDTLFNIAQGAKIGKYSINDVGNRTGQMNFQEILRRSSNIGTVQIAEIIWRDIGEFYKIIMLGDLIKFDDIITAVPKIDYYKAPKYKYLSYCMGYSFSTGMLQVLRAFSSIFTGKIYNPSIIHTNIPKKPLQIIDFHNKKLILDVLLAISDTNPILKKYKVFGKTGTARIIINGTYVKNLLNTFYICSFMKNGKRYFMLLCMERPNSVVMEASGNVKIIAADIINNIMKTNL